jgi:hypothetical protein
MKNLLPLVVLVCLTACTGKFDTDVYRDLTDMALLTNDGSVACQHMLTSHDSTLPDLLAHAQHAETWLSEKSDDTDMHKISVQILDEVTRFHTIMSKGNVSMVFCQAKIKNINDTVRIGMRAQGKKDR